MSLFLSAGATVLQVSVSTRYEQRLDDQNLRNYGRMVIELASTVPDGLVVFFVSYSYMDYVITRWHEDGMLAELINHKLIFIETQVRFFCFGCQGVRTPTGWPHTAQSGEPECPLPVAKHHQ